MVEQKKRRLHSNVGFSITQNVVEAVVFSKRDFAVESSYSHPLPEGVISHSGDEVLQPAVLAQVIQGVFKQLKNPGRVVNLSLPGTLLRMVEMPKLPPSQLFMALSSEAERYKAFDNTEAIVDFTLLEGGQTSANTQRVAFAAIRRDSLESYLRAFHAAKIKIASIDIEPLNILRGMAGTGVLDSLIGQIGVDAYWGALFVSPECIRVFLWRGNNLFELREVHMDTTGFSAGEGNPMLVSDLIEEIQRTTKSADPEIWLTHNLPSPMSEVLGRELGKPVRDCLLGPTLRTDNPHLMISTIGSALSSQISFPFDFNLLPGTIQVKGSPTSSPEAADLSGDSPLPSMMVAGSLVAGVLMLLLWGGFSLYNNMLAGEQTAWEGKRQTVTNNLITLNGRMKQLQELVKVKADVLEMVRNAKTRNLVYERLAEDLRAKTPSQVWLHDIKVDDRISFEGKALNHQSVLAFAKSFDNVPYTGSVLISAIKEGFVGKNTVFDFKIDGNVKLDPSLLKEAETVQSSLQGVE